MDRIVESDAVESEAVGLVEILHWTWLLGGNRRAGRPLTEAEVSVKGAMAATGGGDGMSGKG